MGLPLSAHIRHGAHAGALWVVGALTGRGDPLVRRAVGDPGRDAAVQVDDGPVVGEAETLRNEGVLAGSAARWILWVIKRERLSHCQHVAFGGWPGAHHRGVDGDEQVAACAGGQQVAEQDAHRPVFLGDDGWSEIIGWAASLPVTAQRGRRQVGVHLLGILDQLNFVVIATGVRGGVGYRDRDVLAEVIGCVLRPGPAAR